MATQPFKLITSTPADPDIVSQFPALDRGDKDIVQSWMLHNHNVDGDHSSATFSQVGITLSDGVTVVAAPSPSAQRSALYRDTDGALKIKNGDDGSIEQFPVPTGTIVFYGGLSIPTGWLACNGQSLSTTTFARLFSYIGYNFGGSGPSFLLPDLRGRVAAGLDSGGSNRITATLNWNGTVMGNGGGNESHNLVIAEIPTTSLTPSLTGSISLVGSVSQSGTMSLTGTPQAWPSSQSDFQRAVGVGGVQSGGSFNALVGGAAVAVSTSVTPAGSVNVNTFAVNNGSLAISNGLSVSAVSFGSSQPHSIMQPTLMLNAIIHI